MYIVIKDIKELKDGDSFITQNRKGQWSEVQLFELNMCSFKRNYLIALIKFNKLKKLS